MGRGSEPWRSAPAQHCGTAMAPLLCRFALVLTRDPSGKHPRHPPLFPPTLPRQQNRSSRMRMKRWCLEVTFEEGHAHLGIETQRQWSDRAIERSTPLLFGLYSLVTLFGQVNCAPADLWQHTPSMLRAEKSEYTKQVQHKVANETSRRILPPM